MDEIKGQFYENLYDIEDSFILKRHPNLGFQSHFHAAIEIYYVISGKMIAVISGNEYHLSENEMIIVNSFETHTYFMDGNADVYVLILSRKYLADFQSEYANNLLPTYLNDKEYNIKFKNIFDRIPTSTNNNSTLSLLAKKACANYILDLIINCYGLTTTSKQHEQLNNMIMYIYENFQENITLSALSKKFHYAPTSISRLLTKYLRLDLRTFINSIRAEKANIMLHNEKYKNVNILQIASMCGFDSLATFYRAYKRRYNKLPRNN